MADTVFVWTLGDVVGIAFAALALLALGVIWLVDFVRGVRDGARDRGRLP